MIIKKNHWDITKNIHISLLRFFDFINIIVFCIFLFGYIFNKPFYVTTLLLFLKLFYAGYLLYRFNYLKSTEKNHCIKIDQHDKQIIFSCCVHLIILSLASYVQDYIDMENIKGKDTTYLKKVNSFFTKTS